MKKPPHGEAVMERRGLAPQNFPPVAGKASACDVDAVRREVPHVFAPSVQVKQGSVVVQKVKSFIVREGEIRDEVRTLHKGGEGFNRDFVNDVPEEVWVSHDGGRSEAPLRTREGISAGSPQ